MALPRFLAENLFNVPSQFGDHTLSANEKATGREVFRVADNRRTKTYWTPTTENSDAWVKVDAGSGNSPHANMIVLDRESNLEGETVTLEISADDSTWSQIFQATLPTSESTDGDLSASNGVLTSEGAWMRTLLSDNLLLADAGPEHSWTSQDYQYSGFTSPLSDWRLEPGDTLSVSADVKSDTGADNVKIIVSYKDSSGSYLPDDQTTAVATSSYQRVKAEDFQIPSNATEIGVLARNEDQTETAYARRAMLNKGDTALAFEQPNRARYWRLTVSAMGSGLKPEIYGLWLGESWQPNFHLRLPFTWGERRLVGSETTSDVGWRGTVNRNVRREAEIGLRLQDKTEYDDFARYHIEELYLSGEPMWIVFDDKKAERSWLSKVSPGRTGFEVPDSGWGFQQIRFPAVEHQAALD